VLLETNWPKHKTTLGRHGIIRQAMPVKTGCVKIAITATVT
jgi:hypothetical protein